MKRGAGLQRHERLRPGKSMRRTWIKRRPPRRIEDEKIFRPYLLWLHGDGKRCVVCGTTRSIQGAHVARARGTSLKHGFTYDMVRLCSVKRGRIGCHQQFDQRKGRFDGWPDDARDAAARAWRLVHWEAFSAWVGVEVSRRDVDPVWAAQLVACEEAIFAARAALLPGQVAA